MLCYLFVSVASDSLLSSQVYVQMYICKLLLTQPTPTFLSLSSSSKYCQTELIFLQATISVCPLSFTFALSGVCRRREEQVPAVEAGCMTLRCNGEPVFFIFN